MSDPKKEKEELQLSCYIYSTLESMKNLIDWISAHELMEENRIFYMGILRYLTESILEKMEGTGDEALQRKDFILSAFESLRFADARILLVDNDQSDINFIERVVCNYNVEIDIATSAERAMELYTEQEYDIVFMNYVMPEIDGVKLIHCIRQISERGENQMFVGIFSNENAIQHMKSQLNQLGVELLIMKPLQEEHLVFILMNEMKDKIVQN